MDHIKRAVWAWSVISWVCCGSIFAEPLTILHTNDMGGRFEQMIKAAALKAQVQQTVGRVVLLDAGNTLSSREMDFEHTAKKASPTVDLMNRAGYDAWVLGKRELEISRHALTDFIRSATFPVLAANLHQPQSGRMLFQVQPYMIKRVGGIRLGVVGLSQGGQDLLAGDPIRAARYFVPMLRREVDVVIALTHHPYDIDSTLAVEVPGIDAIVGTQSHGADAGLRVVNGVPIRQAGPNGDFVGRIDLDVSDAGVTFKNAQLLPLDVSVGQTGELTSTLNEWQLLVDGEFLSITSVLGNSAGGFGASVGQAGAMGYLVSDLMRSAAQADVALVSATSLDSELPQGPIRVMDLYRVYAPGHKMKVVSLKGEQLRTLMEDGLEDLADFFYPSGLSIVYDLSQPKSSRLVSLANAEGRPLNLQKTYRVAVESGVARFGGGSPVDMAIRDLLGRHIKKAGVIRGNLDNRMREP